MTDAPDTCGRKPNPERKSCGFINIRIRVNWPKIKECVSFAPKNRRNMKTAVDDV